VLVGARRIERRGRERARGWRRRRAVRGAERCPPEDRRKVVAFRVA
jgi:hypothetical protein